MKVLLALPVPTRESAPPLPSMVPPPAAPVMVSAAAVPVMFRLPVTELASTTSMFLMSVPSMANVPV